jgi:hypothetical protein
MILGLDAKDAAMQVLVLSMSSMDFVWLHAVYLPM